MVNELDDVILMCDLPEHGLSAGDIGTAVLVHRHAAGYEVEFTPLDGETIAVVTLMASQVPPAQTGEMAHVAPREHRDLRDGEKAQPRYVAGGAAGGRPDGELSEHTSGLPAADRCCTAT